MLNCGQDLNLLPILSLPEFSCSVSRAQESHPPAQCFHIFQHNTQTTSAILLNFLFTFSLFLRAIVKFHQDLSPHDFF